MPANDPSSAARGEIRVNASPKNDSTNLSTPITTSDAAPSCQVAIAAASSSMPPCLTATNVGPSTNSAMQMLRSEEHTSEIQALMRITDAVISLQQQTKHQH